MMTALNGRGTRAPARAVHRVPGIPARARFQLARAHPRPQETRIDATADPRS